MSEYRLAFGIDVTKINDLLNDIIKVVNYAKDCDMISLKRVETEMTEENTVYNMQIFTDTKEFDNSINEIKDLLDRVEEAKKKVKLLKKQTNKES